MMASGGYDSSFTRRSRIVLLLMKCSTKAMRKLLLHCVSSYGLSVDNFLITRKARISRSTVGRTNDIILFPPSGKTDINVWDISLLVYILKTECTSLPVNIITNLDNLRKIRNDTFHCYEPDLDESLYTKLKGEIKGIIDEALKFLGDTSFTTETFMDIREIEESAMVNEVTLYTQMIHQWIKYDDYVVNTIDDLKKEVTKLTEKVETGFGEVKSCLVNIGKQLGTHICIPPPSDMDVKLNGMDVDKRRRRNANRKVVSYMTENEVSDQDNEEWKPVELAAKFCKKLKRGQTTKEVKDGSIILTIQFDSYPAFVSLIEDSMSGALTEHFRPIQDAVRRIPGYETYTLKADICEHSYLPFLQDLETKLSQPCQGRCSEFQRGLDEQTRDVHLMPEEDRSLNLDSTTYQSDDRRFTIQNETDEKSKVLEALGKLDVSDDSGYSECQKVSTTDLDIIDTETADTDAEDTDERGKALQSVCMLDYSETKYLDWDNIPKTYKGYKSLSRMQIMDRSLESDMVLPRQRLKYAGIDQEDLYMEAQDKLKTSQSVYRQGETPQKKMFSDVGFEQKEYTMTETLPSRTYERHLADKFVSSERLSEEKQSRTPLTTDIRQSLNPHFKQEYLSTEVPDKSETSQSLYKSYVHDKMMEETLVSDGSCKREEYKLPVDLLSGLGYLYPASMCVLSSNYLVLCGARKCVNVLDISSLPNIHLCDSYLDLGPSDVTVINEEKIAVTEPYNRQIQFLSVVKGKIGLLKEETLHVSEDCYGIDNDGQHLFVATEFTDDVWILDFEGNVLKTIKGFRKHHKPSSLAYDFTDNSLYICNWPHNNVTHITTDGKVKSVISNLRVFSSLVSDSKKYLYLATEDGIVQLNTELSEATVLYKGDTYGCGIACSKPGDLFVVDLHTRKLQVFRFEEGTKSLSRTQAND